MLEVNVYDNFNPNYYNISDYKLPNGQFVRRPLPAPKARCVIMDYELSETGYLYTSSGTLSYTVEVGDVIEVLFPEKKPVEFEPNKTVEFPLAYLYVVTDVDEGNKATLKNYFWRAIEGLDVPNVLTKSTKFGVIDYLVNPSRTNLMSYGYIFNSLLFSGQATINRKAETSEGTDVAKRIFSNTLIQPFSFIAGADNPYVTTPTNALYYGFASKQWSRTADETRIDYKQNIVVEYETVIERSAYNFAVVFVKNPTTEEYPLTPKQYVCKDNGTVIDYSTYNGDGTDLPETRKTKTLFYDEEPTIAQIRAEITPSSVATRLIFDQNPLQPLYTNDLINIWYEGILYKGYVADTIKTETTHRIVFMEGVQ